MVIKAQVRHDIQQHSVIGGKRALYNKECNICSMMLKRIKQMLD